MDGNCQDASVIYQATVKHLDNNVEANYIGLTENTFKTRYNLHTCSFRNTHHRNDTTLSQYIWKLNDDKIQYLLHWKIVTKCKPYSPSTKCCNLCLNEKYYIIFKRQMASLNHRNELTTGCRHKRKFLVCNT